MTDEQLRQAVSEIPRCAQRIKDRGYRQIWRLEVEGAAYFVKFYPHALNRWKNRLRGNSAAREAKRLQWLAGANLAAPAVAGVFENITIEGEPGDAIALRAIEPAMTLDRIIEQNNGQLPDRRAIVRKMLDLLAKLDDAGLGHGDLHLGNFLLADDGTLYLLDGHAMHRGGLCKRDVLHLWHSVHRYATRADRLRGWRYLRGLEPMPRFNLLSEKFWRKAVRRSLGENRYFGRLRDGQWRGHFFKRYPVLHHWSAASGMAFARQDWQSAWQTLHRQIEADALQIIKRSRSGDVLSGELKIGQHTLPIIVKRPRRKFWYRAVLEVIRPTRARRAWMKAWALIVRNLPTAFPLLLMQHKRFGYVTDALIVFEKVDGPMLAKIDLDAMPAADRDRLFHRLGALLRRLESLGRFHGDAKSVNFIIGTDATGGPMPIMVDVDGIRTIEMNRSSIERLLRSMREHPQYTPADSLALCRGFAPHARRYSDPSQKRHHPSPSEGTAPTD